jgi:subtilisin family serine protease
VLGTAPYRPQHQFAHSDCNNAGPSSMTAVAIAHTSTNMDPLGLVNLRPLMERTSGRADIVVGVLDGPVATGVSSLTSENIREASGFSGTCSESSGMACQHGTFVAGVLSARRSSAAPAICPDCTLHVRPIFLEVSGRAGDLMPRATAEELAAATLQSVEAGVHVLNLSVALVGGSAKGERPLRDALDYAMRRGTVVVAAAGNQKLIGSSVITAHPWVIPVVSYSLLGRPLDFSNLGASIGKRGLGAPGERVASLAPDGKLVEWTGTSVAAPFVAGAIALLWSEFPKASAAAVRFVVTNARPRNRSIVPPLLDAWAAYVRMGEVV